MTQIEQIKLGDLIPYINNAKKHDDEQINKIASSIKNFGFGSPIIIDKQNEIICGHGRYRAAQKLGLETVPCVRMSDLTPSQVKAYRLADNKLQELGGGWDDELLRIELEDIQIDIDIGEIGFEPFEDASFDNIEPNTSSKEIDTESFELDCKCPKCGFEFNK
jgi:ParB family chromosome partitioning protein